MSELTAALLAGYLVTNAALLALYILSAALGAEIPVTFVHAGGRRRVHPALVVVGVALAGLPVVVMSLARSVFDGGDTDTDPGD